MHQAERRHDAVPRAANHVRAGRQVQCALTNDIIDGVLLGMEFIIHSMFTPLPRVLSKGSDDQDQTNGASARYAIDRTRPPPVSWAALRESSA